MIAVKISNPDLKVRNVGYKILNMLKKELDVESYNDVVKYLLRPTSDDVIRHCKHSQPGRRPECPSSE